MKGSRRTKTTIFHLGRGTWSGDIRVGHMIIGLLNFRTEKEARLDGKLVRKMIREDRLTEDRGDRSIQIF